MVWSERLTILLVDGCCLSHLGRCAALRLSVTGMGQADSERWCMVCMFYDGGVYLCTSVTISTKVLTVGKTCNCNSLSTGRW